MRMFCVSTNVNMTEFLVSLGKLQMKNQFLPEMQCWEARKPVGYCLKCSADVATETSLGTENVTKCAQENQETARQEGQIKVQGMQVSLQRKDGNYSN